MPCLRPNEVPQSRISVPTFPWFLKCLVALRSSIPSIPSTYCTPRREGAMPPERNGPIFRCSHCDKSYSRREHLLRHQRSCTSPLVSSGSHFACSFGEQMRIKGPSNVLNATNNSIAGAAIDYIWSGRCELIRCRRDLLHRHLLRHDSKKDPAPPSRVAKDVIEFHVVSLLRREYMFTSQN